MTVDLHSYGMETTAITDGTGDYRIEDVPAGPAELTFKLINFTIVRRTLIVIPGQTVTADAVLGLSLTADIVVTGTRTFRNIADLENPQRIWSAWRVPPVRERSRPNSWRHGRSCGPRRCSKQCPV